MNRRGFLKLLGIAAAGAAMPLELDPERLLWVPGAKSIFDLGRAADPDVLVRLTNDGVEVINLRLANALLTPDIITREALTILKNNLELSKFLNRSYEERFTQGARIGYTVNMRRPDRLIGGRPTVVLRPGEDFITINPRTT